MNRDRINSPFRPVLLAAAGIVAALQLSGCSPSSIAKLAGVSIPSTTTYALSGTVSGLAGSGMVVSDGTDSVTVSSNGAFKFPSGVMSGMSYYVNVVTPPAKPTQSCTVTNGSGTITNANVTDVTISCVTASFMVSGSVTGMTGTGLVLADNGGDAVTVSYGGYFSFPSPVASGQPYAVTVKTAPVNPAQVCTVTNGSGIMADADVSNVTVTCTTAAGTPTALVTPTGWASGTAVSGPVDSHGGTLVSADGRLVVTIPSGALSAATTVTIQPIVDEAPGGQGLAYRLGPAGQALAKPVTLSFNYTRQDVRGSAPELLRVAYQDAQQGYWHEYLKPTLDTQAQTEAATTTQFGDFALVLGAEITPSVAGVKPGAALAVNIAECPTVNVNDPDTALVAACGAPAAGGTPVYAGWSVNGVAGGSAATGTMVPSADGASGIYTAPSMTPVPNPVTVSVKDSAPGNGAGTATLVAEFTSDSCGTPSGLCSWSGSSSFATAQYYGVASVTWVLSPGSGSGNSVYSFVPGSGSVSVRATDPTCSVSPATIALPDVVNTAMLSVDYTSGSPSYQLQGTVGAGRFTLSCPGQSPSGLSVVFATSAGAAKQLSADGKTIAGSDTTGGSGSAWTFAGN